MCIFDVKIYNELSFYLFFLHFKVIYITLKNRTITINDMYGMFATNKTPPCCRSQGSLQTARRYFILRLHIHNIIN